MAKFFIDDRLKGNKAYTEGFKQGYAKGIEEQRSAIGKKAVQNKVVWETTCRIMGDINGRYSDQQKYLMFGTIDDNEIFSNYTVEQIMEKVKTFKELEPGDVVNYLIKQAKVIQFTVTHVYKNCVDGITRDGRTLAGISITEVRPIGKVDHAVIKMLKNKADGHREMSEREEVRKYLLMILNKYSSADMYKMGFKCVGSGSASLNPCEALEKIINNYEVSEIISKIQKWQSEH